MHNVIQVKNNDCCVVRQLLSINRLAQDMNKMTGKWQVQLQDGLHL